MAKLTLDGRLPQINRPVGSLDELKVLGVSGRNVCSCSARAAENAGCPVEYACDRKWRTGATSDRPQMQVMRLTTRDGRVRVTESPCFNIVKKELDADDKGNLVEIIGGEGDTYIYRGSVKLHPVRDPDCNDCARGQCNKWVDRNDLTKVCEPFPPAATHPELLKFAHKVRARVETGVQKRESLRAQHYGLLTPDSPLEPEKETKGAGKR